MEDPSFAVSKGSGRFEIGTSPVAAVAAFLRGDANARPDGVTLEQVLTRAKPCTDDVLAWMFPVDCAGDPLAPEAPVLSGAEFKTLRGDPAICSAVEQSYFFVLDGLDLVRDHHQWVFLSHRRDPARTEWVRTETPWDLRLGRVLRCLALFRLDAQTTDGRIYSYAEGLLDRLPSILHGYRRTLPQLESFWRAALIPGWPLWDDVAVADRPRR